MTTKKKKWYDNWHFLFLDGSLTFSLPNIKNGVEELYLSKFDNTHKLLADWLICALHELTERDKKDEKKT